MEVISEVTLAPYETRKIRIAITAKKTMVVAITDVTFTFHRFFPCTQSLYRRGKRLYGTKAQRITPTYADASTSTLHVGVSRPQLSAGLERVPNVLYTGEEVDAIIRLTNVGKVAVDEIQLVTNRTGTIRIPDPPGLCRIPYLESFI